MEIYLKKKHVSPSKKMRRENIYNSLSLQNNVCHTNSLEQKVVMEKSKLISGHTL